MIMSGLSIFQAWMGVGITKFLNDLGVRNIFNTIIRSVSMLAFGWLSVLLRYCRGLNAVVE